MAPDQESGRSNKSRSAVCCQKLSYNLEGKLVEFVSQGDESVTTIETAGVGDEMRHSARRRERLVAWCRRPDTDLSP